MGSVLGFGSEGRFRYLEASARKGPSASAPRVSLLRGSFPLGNPSYRVVLPIYFPFCTVFDYVKGRDASNDSKKLKEVMREI